MARAPEACSTLNRRIASEGYAIFFCSEPAGGAGIRKQGKVQQRFRDVAKIEALVKGEAA
ncbi:MAG: hypothetical protein WCA13_00020 [Terriglobales bacterium]